MKRGQLLSQPFFYIFAIIVIGMIFVFGFKYIGKLMNAGCEVEAADFIGDVQSKVNELASLSFGSSYNCGLVKASGKSGNSCEFVIPASVDGICFADTSTVARITTNKIIFSNLKTLIRAGVNRNLFFSIKNGANCKAQHAKINKLTTEDVVCVKSGGEFIMENAGNKVKIKPGL